MVAGIYSKGNPSHQIFPWFDIYYIDEVEFKDEKPKRLSQMELLDEELFRLIGNFVLPGGLIIISFITDISYGLKSKIYEVTHRSLSLSTLEIPPAATPLGRLLFASGCRNIKSQAYDVQGSSRLAGEKAPNPEYESRFTQDLKGQLEKYLARKPHPGFQELEKTCRAHSKHILDQMTGRT